MADRSLIPVQAERWLPGLEVQKTHRHAHAWTGVDRQLSRPIDHELIKPTEAWRAQ
jgi:hypothetical protein